MLPLGESEFWSQLEWRLCRELLGMRDGRLCNLWCDGFSPGRYMLNDPRPQITGMAWIGDGDELDEWSFALFLPGPVAAREAIDWESLLPPEDVTRWLSLDCDRRHLEMEPSVAQPDPPKPAKK